MSKLTFTPKQIQFLKTNPYVKNVSEKSITYSDEFKRHFVSESLDSKTSFRHNHSFYFKVQNFLLIKSKKSFK